jgi:hypothetical protein
MMEVSGQLHPRAGLEAVSRRKIPSPRRDSNPDHPIVQFVELSMETVVKAMSSSKVSNNVYPS